MKIVPYVHRMAPELCYFTVNGVRYTEKPAIGMQVNWYKVMTSADALHPIAEIRKKHFKPQPFQRLVSIDIVYEDPKDHWLNQRYSGIITDWSVLRDSKFWDNCKKKHPTLNGEPLKLEFGEGYLSPCKAVIKTYTRGR